MDQHVLPGDTWSHTPHTPYLCYTWAPPPQSCVSSCPSAPRHSSPHNHLNSPISSHHSSSLSLLRACKSQSIMSHHVEAQRRRKGFIERAVLSLSNVVENRRSVIYFRCASPSPGSNCKSVTKITPPQSMSLNYTRKLHCEITKLSKIMSLSLFSLIKKVVMRQAQWRGYDINQHFWFTFLFFQDFIGNFNLMYLYIYEL